LLVWTHESRALLESGTKMSLRKNSIKIIKRKQVDFLKIEPRIASSSLKTENQITRELVRTVTSWIEERQKRTSLMWLAPADESTPR